MRKLIKTSRKMYINDYDLFVKNVFVFNVSDLLYKVCILRVFKSDIISDHESIKTDLSYIKRRKSRSFGFSRFGDEQADRLKTEEKEADYKLKEIKKNIANSINYLKLKRINAVLFKMVEDGGYIEQVNLDLSDKVDFDLMDSSFEKDIENMKFNDSCSREYLEKISLDSLHKVVRTSSYFSF